MTMTLREAFDQIAPVATLDWQGHDQDVNFPNELVQGAVLHTLRELIEIYFFDRGFITRNEAAQCADAYIQAWIRAWLE